MSVLSLTAQELPGLFELNDAGTVLYYRSDPDCERDAGSPDMAGHNFYEEVARFENIEEFRQCVSEFTRGVKAADSFDFDCHYEDSTHLVRVLLARICERVNDQNSTKSVLVHIRQGAILTSPEMSEVNGHERNVDQ